MKHPFTKRIIAIFLMLVAIGLIFLISPNLQDLYFKAVKYFEEPVGRNPLLGAILFTSLAAVSAMLSAFSSIPLVPAAVFWWGESLTFGLLLAGWVIGGALSYAVGRYAGHPFIKRFLFFQKLEEYEKQIPKKAEFSLVLLFRLSMPAEIPGYILGILKYDFWKYLFATLLAELPFAVMVVFASGAIVRKEPIVYFAATGAGIILILSIFYLFRKKLKRIETIK